MASKLIILLFFCDLKFSGEAEIFFWSKTICLNCSNGGSKVFQNYAWLMQTFNECFFIEIKTASFKRSRKNEHFPIELAIWADIKTKK